MIYSNEGGGGEWIGRGGGGYLARQERAGRGREERAEKKLVAEAVRFSVCGGKGGGRLGRLQEGKQHLKKKKIRSTTIGGLV